MLNCMRTCQPICAIVHVYLCVWNRLATPIFYDPRCVSIACCYCNRFYVRCWVVLLLGLPLKYWKSARWIPGSSEFTKGEEARQEKLKQCSHSTQTGVSKHICRSQDCRCCVCVCVCSYVLVSMWIACAWECQAYVQICKEKLDHVIMYISSNLHSTNCQSETP